MSKQDNIDRTGKPVPDKPDTKQENGVPGAFGDKEEFTKGQSGVTHVRGDHDEIQPSEDVGDDKD